MKNDSVSHPAYYTDGNIEVIDYIEDKGFGYHLGNAIKYISRAGKKDPKKTAEDLRKAVWYIERYIGLIEGEKDDENILKFYYVESIDDYWIGMRIGNFYYADWHEGLGFVWSHSRYLPWGEHITDETTLWKEHTYPSEPVEMPFTEWIIGFMKKHSLGERREP